MKIIEKIICSAIHVDDNEVYPGNHPSGILFGFVVCGRRHADCHNTLERVGRQDLESKVERHHQGFLTNKDRFVGRKEAMIIAKHAGQLLRPELHVGIGSQLTSEDLFLD